MLSLPRQAALIAPMIQPSPQQPTDVTELCNQLLEALPSESAALVIQLKLRSWLFQSLQTQACYPEAQIQLQLAQTILDELKTLDSTQISLPLELFFLDKQGSLARVQGHYADAETYFQTALQLAVVHDYASSSFRLQCLNNLAIVYKYWGRFETANDLYTKLLAGTIEQYGESHIAVATIYHNLAGLHHACRDYAAAEPYARKSYLLHLHSIGPEHDQTIADGAALASILHGLGQWDEAIEYFENAIAFFKAQFGTTHYDVALNLNNLAASLQAKGDFDGAEMAYRQALTIKEIILGKDHPETAISLNNLASLLQKTGNYRESAELFEQAISLFETTVGPMHPNTQLCRKNYDALTTSLTH